MTGPGELPLLTAADVPMLRRELIGYMDSGSGAEMYHMMIEIGRQPIRPPGPPATAARMLADTEAGRLQQADMWFIDADLADLVDSATPTMPAFAARPFDLPSPYGFVVFARPLTCMVREPPEADKLVGELLGGIDSVGKTDAEAAQVRALYDGITAHGIAIYAASWGPVETSALRHTAHRWQAGGVWMSFWSMPAGVRDPELMRVRAGAAAAAAYYQTITARLIVDNEAIIGWWPEGEPPDRWLISPQADGGTAAWAAAVMTAFLLSRQGNVAEQDTEAVARPERRGYEKAGLPAPPPVRVLRLRQSVREHAPREAGPGRTYRHRWVVRGHWRNVWYPSIQSHRPRWIAPYLAGPDGAPLLGGEKVTVVGAPPAPPEGGNR